MENFKIIRQAFDKQTSYRKLELIAIFIFQFTIFLSFAILIPLKEQLIERLHISENQFITAILINLLGVFVGFVANKYLSTRREISLTIFYESLTAVLFLWHAVSSFGTLLSFRMLTGIIGGAILFRSMQMIRHIFGQHLNSALLKFTLNSFKLYFVVAILASYIIIVSDLADPLLILACMMFAISIALLEVKSRDRSDYEDRDFIF